FFFQAEDGIRDRNVTGVQTCALPIFHPPPARGRGGRQGGHDRFRPDPAGVGDGGRGQGVADVVLADQRQTHVLRLLAGQGQGEEIGRASCRAAGESAADGGGGRGETA